MLRARRELERAKARYHQAAADAIALKARGDDTWKDAWRLMSDLHRPLQEARRVLAAKERRALRRAEREAAL